MRNKQLKSGDIIFIEEEHKRIIKCFLDRENGIQVGIACLSEMLKEANQETWGTIQSLYPEMKGFKCTLNSGDMKIRILYKKNGKEGT